VPQYKVMIETGILEEGKMKADRLGISLDVFIEMAIEDALIKKIPLIKLETRPVVPDDEEESNNNLLRR